MPFPPEACHPEEALERVKHTLGGFIDSLAERGYVEEFRRCFTADELTCERGSDNLIRCWRLDRLPLNDRQRKEVESWHVGYRACLRQQRPADYL